MLRLQDPDDPLAPTLLEEILAASEGAESGGAIFSYARPNGIDLLLRDPEFQAFLQRGQFEIVVGVDGVTNVAALDRLQAISAESRGLSARVFLHDRSGTTFHPKVCWFHKRNGGVALVGSGNLTLGGLTSNWEGFTLVPLSNSEVRSLEAQWRTWKALHRSQLRELSDPDVRARAARNVVTRPDRNVQDDRPTTRRPASDSPVLIAEVPRASDRWNQANFDLDSFVNFFHADDPRRRLQLWHVSNEGTIAPEPEVRPGVAVRSRNFRVELRAAAGLPYPTGGRPIGLFIATGPRSFLYMLVMPRTSHYPLVSAILGRHSTSPRNQVRRARLSVSELRREWPASPLWSYTSAAAANG
jgi:HKD family nuclease